MPFRELFLGKETDANVLSYSRSYFKKGREPLRFRIASKEAGDDSPRYGLCRLHVYLQDGITAVGLLTCDEEHSFVIKITDGLGEEGADFFIFDENMAGTGDPILCGRPMHVRYISADGVRRRLTLERESILSLSHWICRAEEDTDDTAAMFFLHQRILMRQIERSEKNRLQRELRAEKQQREEVEAALQEREDKV